MAGNKTGQLASPESRQSSNQLSEEKVQKIEIKSVIAILLSRVPSRTLELSSAKSELFTAGCRLQLQGGYGKYQVSKLLSF